MNQEESYEKRIITDTILIDSEMMLVKEKRMCRTSVDQ